MNLTLSQKGLILVALPLFFELVFVAVLFGALQDAEAEVSRAEHASTVTSSMNTIIHLVVKAGHSAFLYIKAPNKVPLKAYQDTITEIEGQFDTLQQAFVNDPQTLASVNDIHQTVDRALMYMAESLREARNGNTQAAMYHLDDLKQLREDMVARTERVTSRYHQVLSDSPKRQADFRAQLRTSLLWGVLGNVIMAIALAIYFNRGTAARLHLLVDNTARLARNQELNPPLPGKDEIAHLDKTFHDMAMALEEAARLKRQLIAVVSHELRTPLTSVLGFLNLLVDEVYCPLPPEVKDRSKSAEANVEQLIRLINDLIDIEKMESGKLNMTFTSSSLQSVVERSYYSLRELAESHNVSITIEPTTLQAHADANRLTQVLINLLSNAIKFSPKDQTISVSCSKSENMVVVSVADRAETIPAELHEAIFERFRQVKASDETEKGGSGLGLAICKSIIEQHGGTIGVKSRSDGGNEFWFAIPTAQESGDHQVTSL